MVHDWTFAAIYIIGILLYACWFMFNPTFSKVADGYIIWYNWRGKRKYKKL